MTTSIYLSNNTVQIILGTAGKKEVRVEQIYALNLTEGSLLNGVITSEFNLKNDLKRIWEQYKLPTKNVRLVLDSSQIMTKNLTVQRANDKKTDAAIEAEFAGNIQMERYLIDRTVIKIDDQKKQEILAVAAESDYIQEYIHLFNEIGVTLESIDASINAQMKVFGRIAPMQDMTVITSHLDGNNLISTLLVKGSFVYFNRTRLFSEHGTEGFASEVARTISSLMQFYSSQKYEEPLETVYMAGYSEEDYISCAPEVEKMGIKAEIPANTDNFVLPALENVVIHSTLADEPLRTCDYIFAIGALIGKKEDINLVKKYTKSIKGKGTSINTGKLLLIAIILGVCVVASAAVLGLNFMKQKQIAKVESYINDQKNQEAYADALQKQSDANRMQSSVSLGQSIWGAIQSYPLPNSKVQQEIIACAGSDVSITVNSYDDKTGVYALTATSGNVTTINEFIARLRESNVFADLEYSGYTMDEKSGGYLINVSGFLAESSGK